MRFDTSTGVGQRGPTQSPNPSISGTAVVEAINSNQPTARHEDAEDAQAALDEADLREVERANYYGDGGTPTEAPATKPHRGLLDRLLRR